MKKIYLSLLTITFCGATAMAQTQPWEGPIETIAANGFKAGASSGLSPQTDGENFDCAVSWDVWHSAFAGNLIPATIEQNLPSDLSRGVTTTTRNEWRQVVAKAQSTTPILALIKIIEPTKQRNKTQNQVIEGLRGDTAQLFRITNTLGICGSPPRTAL